MAIKEQDFLKTLDYGSEGETPAVATPPAAPSDENEFLKTLDYGKPEFKEDLALSAVPAVELPQHEDPEKLSDSIVASHHMKRVLGVDVKPSAVEGAPEYADSRLLESFKKTKALAESHYKHAVHRTQGDDLYHDLLDARENGKSDKDILAKIEAHGEMPPPEKPVYPWEKAAAFTAGQVPVYADIIKSGVETGLSAGMLGAAGALAAGQAGPQAAVPEEVVTAPAAFASFYAAGQTYGSGKAIWKMMEGNAYSEMLSAGVDEKWARKLSRYGVGPISAGLNIASFGMFKKMAPVAVRKFLGDVTAKTSKGLIKGRAGKLLLATTTEVGTENLEEINQIIMTEVGINLTNELRKAKGLELIPGITREEFVTRIKDVTEATFYATATMGSATTSVSYIADRTANKIRGIDTEKDQKENIIDMTAHMMDVTTDQQRESASESGAIILGVTEDDDGNVTGMLMADRKTGDIFETGPEPSAEDIYTQTGKIPEIEVDVDKVIETGDIETAFEAEPAAPVTEEEQTLDIDDETLLAETPEQEQEYIERRNQKLRDILTKDLTPEQKDIVLLQNEVTHIPNRRAWSDEMAEDPHPIQTAIDLDSLKWVNDIAGHVSGDELLQTMADVLTDITKEHGVKGYHFSGDEYAIAGKDRENTKNALTALHEELEGGTIDWTDENGYEIHVPITFGFGTDEKGDFTSADQRLIQAKESEKAQGLKSDRGEVPKGTQVVDPQGNNLSDNDSKEYLERELAKRKEAALKGREALTDPLAEEVRAGLRRPDPLSTTEQLQSAVDKSITTEGRENLDVEIVQSTGDLAADLDYSVSIDNTVEGAYNPQTGRIYLVADNISADQAWAKLLHEGTHKVRAEQGWSGVFGDAADKIMTEIDTKIEAKDKAWEAAREKAVKAKTPVGKIKEETITYFLAENANQNQSVWKKMATAIRAWAVRNGIKRKITDKDIVALAESSVRRAARNRGIPNLDNHIMYSKRVNKPVDTTSKNFQEWFKDSQVVDENGDPLVVYHGTVEDFGTFKPEDDPLGRTFFSASKSVASTYSQDKGVVMPTYLSLNNPRVVDMEGASFWDVDVDEHGEELDSASVGERAYDEAEIAKKNGNDGVIYKNYSDAYTADRMDGFSSDTVYVTFSPTQIKSAISNTGEFSTEDPRIMFSKRDDELAPLPAVLPRTITYLTANEFKKMAGRDVKVQTLRQVLKQKNIKKIEKEIIEHVLSQEPFAGKDSVPFDQFKLAVQNELMPLETLETTKWADYGANSIGFRIPTVPKSVVYNSPVKHGIGDHFADLFADQVEKVEYEIIQIPEKEDTYIAIDKNRPEGLAPEETENYVGTAGSKERVEAWIKEYEKKKTTEAKAGVFGHVRRWDTGEDRHIAEIQSDFYQKNSPEETIINLILTHPRTEKQKELSDKNWKVIDVIAETPHEIKTSYSQANIIFKEIRGFEKSLKKIEGLGKGYLVYDNYDGREVYIETSGEPVDITGMEDFDFFVHKEDGGYKVSEKSSGRRMTSGGFSTKDEAIGRAALKIQGNGYDYTKGLIAQNQIPTGDDLIMAKDYLQNSINARKKEIAEIPDKIDRDKYTVYFNAQNEKKKLRREAKKTFTIQDKQFIAHRKNYAERMIREEIRKAAQDGMETFRLPTPHTLAAIEGYIETEAGGGMYEVLEGDDTGGDLEVGDVIDYGGENHTVVDADSYNITVIPSDDVRSFSVDQMIEEEIDNAMTDVEYELNRTSLTASNVEGEWFGNLQGDQLAEIIRNHVEQNVEDEDIKAAGGLSDYEVDSDDVIDEIRDVISEEMHDRDWEEWLNEIYYEGKVWLTNNGQTANVTDHSNTESFPQPSEIESTGSDKDTFEIEDLDDTYQGIVRQYEKHGEFLENLSPDTYEIFTDDNDFDWYSIDIGEEVDEAFAQDPVVLFSKKMPEEVKQKLRLRAETIKEIKSLAEQARKAKEAGDTKTAFHIRKKLVEMVGRAKSEAASTLVATMTEKEKSKRRRQSISTIRDYFGLTDNDLKKISRKDVRLMSDYEFKRFKDDIQKRALEFSDTRQAKLELLNTIHQLNLQKVDNFREALELPAIKDMTIQQLRDFDELISQFHEGDTFLNKRQLETADRTFLDGIRTWREAKERLAAESGVPIEELDKIKTGLADSWRWDNALYEANPFYRVLVTRVNASLLDAELKAHQIENEVFALAKRAQNSVKRSVLQRAIPGDQQIFDYLEAKKDDKQALAKQMTPEQLDLAHYMQEYFSQALSYLIETKSLTRGRENYFVHMRRSLLESIKDDGLIVGIKEIFKNYEMDEMAFNILDDNTGNILPLEKFFQFSLRRSGEMTPTKNIVKAFTMYANTFEKKVALDGIVPAMSIYAQALTPTIYTPRGLEIDQSIKKFVNKYINSKKGRKISYDSVVKQGGPLDLILSSTRMFVSMLKLGFSPIAQTAAPIGEQSANLIMMGVANQAKGTARMRTKKGKRIMNKYEGVVGRSLVETITAPGLEVTDRITSMMFAGFHAGSRIANAQYLLGMMTDKEFESETVSTKRLAEMQLEKGRFRAVPGAESLVGATSPGKIGTQFKSWAIPVLRTTAKDLVKFAKDLKNKKLGEAFSTKESAELLRMVAITGSVLAIWGIYQADEDDDSLLNKMINRLLNEASLIYSAFDIRWMVASPVSAKWVRDLIGILDDFIKLAEYEDGTGLRGPRKLVRHFTPGVVKSFQKRKKKKPKY